MKKVIRTLLLATLLTMALCLPAMASEPMDAVPISAPVSTPASAAPSVLLNGEDVTFGDAAPKIMNDRTMIPFRGLFNALGFADEDIVWDAETQGITAKKDDITLSMAIGVPTLTVTRGDQTTELATDVAPTIDAETGRTYVPVSFVAQAMGYRVGWDAWQRVVIIDDVDSILAANTETYALMDAYQDYARQFSKGKWSATGDYAMKITVMEETADVTGSYTMLSEALAMEFDTAMKFSGVIDGVDMAEVLPEVNFSMRGDLAEGSFYVKCNELLNMMEAGVSNAWFKMDLNAMTDAVYQEMLGMSYTDLMQLSLQANDMSFSESLEYMLRTMPLVDASATTTDYLDLFNQFVGDSKFVKSGTTYTSTLTDNATGATVKIILFTGSDGKVTGYAVEIAAEMDSLGSASMVMTMKGREMEFTFNVGVPDMMTMEMTMDGSYRATTQAPAVAPPAEAAVIDLMEMLLGY